VKTPFFIALAASISLRLLSYRNTEITGAIEKFSFLLLMAQLFWTGSVAIRLILDAFIERKFGDSPSASTSKGLLKFLLLTGFYGLIFLTTLSNLGVDITTLIAGLGVGGIAVALAVQNVFGDLLASLSIVLDKPFVLGDFIVVGDLMGTVEYIGLKTTRLRSLSGEQLVFSNSDLLQSRIRNYKRMFERRVVFKIGVIYETDFESLKKIPEIIRSIVEGQNFTRFDRCHFLEYGNFSLDIETVYWIKNPDYNVYADIHQAVLLEIFRIFKAENINFAYPTQLVLHQPANPLPPRPE
jgi:small-conductance mechanosensitive channel